MLFTVYDNSFGFHFSGTPKNGKGIVSHSLPTFGVADPRFDFTVEWFHTLIYVSTYTGSVL